jgi:hypothetical protein
VQFIKLLRNPVYEWYNQFKSGQESLEDERSSRPAMSKSDENVTKVCTVVRSDWCSTIEDIANEIGISCRSVQSILKGKFFGVMNVCEICAMHSDRGSDGEQECDCC